MFGDVITRYEHRMMENDRKRLNKSMKRYEKRSDPKENLNHQKIF
jgi:hypothetical protein